MDARQAQPGRLTIDREFEFFDTLGKVEFRSLRTTVFAGGTVIAALSIAIMSLAVYAGLWFEAHSPHPTIPAPSLVILLSGAITFAALVALMLPLSRRLSQALQPAPSSVSRPARSPADRSSLGEPDASPQDGADVKRCDGSAGPDESGGSNLHQNISVPTSSDLTGIAPPVSGEFSGQSSDNPTSGLSVRDLERANALLMSIVDNLPQSVFCKELDGRYSFANRAFCE